MPERAKRRTASDVLRDQIKEFEQRLAHLEGLLERARAEAEQSFGPVRATQDVLRTSLDRVSRSLVESRRAVEGEIGRLTRALRAGVKAGRDAYQRKRPG